ncbi:MAG: ComEC/Rec2 family competence protein [Pyrinomonadaceae bacterium]
MRAPAAEPDSSRRTSRQPLLWLAGAFACGIAFAAIAGSSWFAALALSSAIAAGAMAFRSRPIAGYILAAAFFFLGVFCFSLEVANVSHDRIRRIYDEGRISSGTPVEIEGRLVGRPEPAFEGVFITIRAQRLARGGNADPASGSVRMFVPVDGADQAGDLAALELRSGVTIRTACALIREDQFLNPGVTPRRQLLDQQGIDATCTVKSPLLFEVIERPGWTSRADIVYEQRSWLIGQFRMHFSPRTAGVLVASLLGDKYFLDRGTAEVFREGGTFHVLVISGLHITFIGGLVLWIVGRFISDRRWQFAVVCSGLWLYTLAVGAEVPVVRACLMFTVFMFGRALYRSGGTLNSLGLCCLLLLSWRPADLFDPSFQLTVVSVAAIVGMAFPLIEKLRSIGRWMPDRVTPFPPNVPDLLRRSCEMLYWPEGAWEIELGRQIWSGRIHKSPLKRLSEIVRRSAAYLFEGVIVSLVVQLWMLPLLIYYFHRVSPVSVLLNLWVGAVIALESLIAVFAVVFAQFSQALSLPFAAATDILNELLVEVPRLFTHIDLASFRVPVYPGAGKAYYIAYFLAVLLVSAMVYRWQPFALRRPGKASLIVTCAAALLIASFGAIAVLHLWSSPAADGRLHVEFLDVGQGDSAFITFPNGETMLVDGGGRVTYKDRADEDAELFEPDVPRIGEQVVSEFLWEKGYSQIDHLVASHADADHAQGLADVVKNFQVGTIYIGAWPEGESELDELFAAAKNRSVPIRQIGRGDDLNIGGTDLETLWPIKGRELSGSDNDSSIVLRLVFGERSFLFTGDIEQNAENGLTTGATHLKADVVKVPHHGSRTSSSQAFIDGTRAEWAVVPVGRRSRFGHPHREVIERWKLAGTTVLTTGERGMVTAATDGKDLKISTFQP